MTLREYVEALNASGHSWVDGTSIISQQGDIDSGNDAYMTFDPHFRDTWLMLVAHDDVLSSVVVKR